MGNPSRNEGEGSRSAARAYNRGVQEFVQSGKVAEKAREATQMTAAQRRAAEQAEKAGKARAKGEDPALRRTGKVRRRAGT